MAKYVKKPVVVEAVKWNGNNIEEVKEFMKEQLDKLHFESMDASNLEEGKLSMVDFLAIQTLEGVMTVSDGDYIIKGVNGEFYPCKPDIFKKTYEPITNKGEENGKQRIFSGMQSQDCRLCE